MNPKWILLAADLLELAYKDFANNGHDDYQLPGEWTNAERAEFVGIVRECVGGVKVEFGTANVPRTIGAPWAMLFLARRLRAMGQDTRAAMTNPPPQAALEEKQ